MTDYEEGPVPPAAPGGLRSAPFLLQPASSAWFDLKRQLLQTVVAQWHGRAMYCDELQCIIDQELRMFDLVKSLYHQEAYTFSRRSVLASLAALPLAFLAPISPLRKLTVYPEEFLPECAAGITSSWYLLNDGDSLAAIEQTLPVYLPKLTTWARQSSRYQRVAAALAAQASLLLDLVAYHRFRFPDSLAYANQAVELARLSGDPNLLAYALLLSGGAYNLTEQTQKMLQQHQQATGELENLLPPLQSYVLAELAYAYAQNHRASEALHAIGEARQRFPGAIGEVPCYLSADYNLGQLILFEGLTHVTLGSHDSAGASNHYKQAETALAQIDHLPPDQFIPQRLRVEMTNIQAQAAIGLGNLDETEQYLLAGIQGATALNSEKRRQEVLANWQAARTRWPQERNLLSLGEALLLQR